MRQQNRYSSRTLAVMGLLCGISVVLGTVLNFNMMLGGVYSVNVALNLLPVQLAGVLYGPLSGFLVGAASDFVKWAVKPIGAYHPGFTFSMAMMGFVPALLLQLLCAGPVSVTFPPKQKGRRVFRLPRLQLTRPVLLVHPPRPDFLMQLTLPDLLFCIAISQTVFSVVLNTCWIVWMSGTAPWVLLPARIVNQFVMIPIYSILLREVSRLCVRYHLV